MSVRGLFVVLRNAVRDWSADRAPLHGAAIAYYAVFSLAPVFLIAVAIASLVFDERAARHGLRTEIHRSISPSFADAVDELLESTARSGKQASITALGLATLLFGASGVFLQLQDALNQIWKVNARPRRRVLAFLRDRAFSLLLVLCTGLLLVASLGVNSLLAGLNHFISAERVPFGIHFWQNVHLGVAFLSFTVLFAMIFKLLPDAHVAWGDVWVGAVVTSCLFMVGEFGIGLYLGRSAMASTFGAAGSLVIVLVWVYYSSLIVLFGAEFTHAMAAHRKPAVHS